MPYKDRERQLEAQRQHYRANKKDYKNSQNEVRERNRRYIWQYLQDKKCKICNEPDPLVLEFDHRDPQTKTDNVTRCSTQRKFSIERLKEELDKCDILCANCHRRKTAIQYGHRKITY